MDSPIVANESNTDNLYALFPMDVQVGVRMSQPMREALREVSAKRGLSVSDVIRMSVIKDPEFVGVYQRHLTRMARQIGEM